jgi:serine/threonine protein kinase
LDCPQYSSKEIRVLEVLAGRSYVTKVLVDGKEMCCKSEDDWQFQAMEREFDCLRKVAISDLKDSIRVPPLLGLVTSAETGKIIGLLEEYIPEGDLSNLRQLDDEDMDHVKVSTEREKKWGAQIWETVDLLHNVGVIRGDGKPDNVLIHDKADDAWVIDFGGGYTKGWVDQELQETLEGDEQALGRIHDFLKI